MSYWQKALREWLEKGLNLNDKGILFNVSLFHAKSEYEYKTYIDTHEMALTKEIKNFIPVLIEDIDVERVQVPTIDIKEGNVLTTVNIPVFEKNIDSEKVFNDVFPILENFAKNNNAQTYPLGKELFDVSNAVIDVNYDGEQDIKHFGATLRVKDTGAFQNIYVSNFGNPNFFIAKENLELKFYFSRTSGSDVVVNFDYTDEELEILISYRTDKRIDVWVNGELKNAIIPEETQATFKTTNTLGDRITGFDGYITSLYAQSTDLENYFDYKDGALDLFGVFDNPMVYVENFKTLENLVEDVEHDLDLVSGVVTSKGQYGYATFGFNSPHPITGLFKIGKQDYQQFDFTFDVIVTDVYMGNMVEFYLDDVRVYPFNRNIAKSSESMSEQMINSNFSSGIITENGLNTELTLFYDDTTKDLYEKIVKRDINLNNTLTLKVVFPTFEEEYKVINTDGGTAPNFGEPINFTISLMPSDDILEEV